MKKYIFSFIVIGFFGVFGFYLSTYLFPSQEKASLASDARFDLLAKSTELIELVRNPDGFNAQNCYSILKDYNETTMGLTPVNFDRSEIEKTYLQIVKNLFQLRFELHERAGDLPQCANEMRNSIRIARYIEEYLLEAYSNTPIFDEKKDAKVSRPLQGGEPFVYLAPGHQELTVRSGDIIISRGNAFTSSAIARMGEIDAQFSHLALVYVDGDDGRGKTYTISEVVANPKVIMLEMHIEIGSTIRPMRTYLTDGNARNVIFRYRKDPRVAHAAAKNMYDYISNHMRKSEKKFLAPAKGDPNHNVPYDFKADMSSTEEMFCTEVGFAGYKNAGVTIPTFTSRINVALDIPKRLGISAREVFLPGDMEIEPQFEMIGEYRDIRKLHDIRMKDAVLTAIYAWQTKYDYRFFPDLLKHSKAAFAWFARNWDIAFKEKAPKNMDPDAMTTVFILEEVGKRLQDHIEFKEAQHLKLHPKEMRTFPQHLEELEKFRHEDRNRYIEKGTSAFHNDFHSMGD